MNLTLGMVTLDCADPRRLAGFWTKALGLEIAEDYDEYIVLRGEGQPVALGLQRVPEPKPGKNRVHLDFGTGDRAAEVARLVALGARELADHEMPGLRWTVLADPDGNEFCVGGYHS
ncbi:putative enzyme related to lactoylglutathione lyase [Prauserella shujinwangii]|uniref:Putative enzyme related to lactoylglutathione lyase n=1 Tax=Prauserella shujinwangii TaxID=1453103 RepID=A0A2T0LWN8_9PSEU|nr:VOC family protein [Prauserella shujinwangii]PRX48441.1 putative enzyme related to lactoylglutathione lyase [Prauserella shujinwangii]